MKTSIAFLPGRKQRDIKQITAIIRNEVQDAVMIILFGSYARNTYVDYDETCAFGIREIYQSDYDILVVTKKRLGLREGTIQTNVTDRFLVGKNLSFQTYPQIISESITKLNKYISDGRYFYVDIINDGITLYDSGEYTLATPRELNFPEIKQQAQEYYKERFEEGRQFYETALFNYSHEWYKLGLFLLHQATERLLKTIPLVYILYGYKEHDLEFLLKKCKSYTFEIAKIFPCDTEEEKHLFDLLKRAYIEARYNPEFVVTKEEFEKILPKIVRLSDLVERVCKERLNYYDSQL